LCNDKGINPSISFIIPAKYEERSKFLFNFDIQLTIVLKFFSEVELWNKEA